MCLHMPPLQNSVSLVLTACNKQQLHSNEVCKITRSSAVTNIASYHGTEEVWFNATPKFVPLGNSGFLMADTCILLQTSTKDLLVFRFVLYSVCYCNSFTCHVHSITSGR